MMSPEEYDLEVDSHVSAIQALLPTLKAEAKSLGIDKEIGEKAGAEGNRQALLGVVGLVKEQLRYFEGLCQ